MRTREEQVAELVDALKKPVCRPDYSINILKMWLETHIQEAEERARAECAADTRRLEWLAASLIDMRIHSQLRTIHVQGPMTAFDFRQSIDIAQKVGK